MLVSHSSRGFAVTDDGAGFVVDENRASGSTGLVNMRERARLVGGRLSIRTRVGEGTVISVNAPLAFLPGSDDNSGEILNQHSSHDRLKR